MPNDEARMTKECPKASSPRVADGWSGPGQSRLTKTNRNEGWMGMNPGESK